VAYSAVQFVSRELGLQVFAIARLTDLLQYLAEADGEQAGNGDSLQAHYQRVLAYRQRYGVD
ncbi:MAG: orotate phosphoribosyltransferase, partial [Polaromonas sp.]|nr:orotate phosphoribosyltransferase [Polaromonas sp.]